MILSTAYLPPISYFQKIVSAESILIEKHEHFVKQTCRNRCFIYGANGILMLSIPLVNTHEKTIISEKRIAYKENWQHQHWRSIESAYRNSPYFIYYADALKPFYENRFEFLLEYNTALLQTLLKILKINTEIKFTHEFEKSAEGDHGNSVLPITNEKPRSYSQVFAEKHGFKPDLSILDLIFNLGPNARNYLQS